MTKNVLKLLEIMEDFDIHLTFSQTIKLAIAMRKVFECECNKNGQL